MTLTDQINASLLEITAPLVQQLRDLEENIALREEELKELRAGRTKLVTIVRQINPELAPKMVYPKKSKTLVPVSAEKVKEVLHWLALNVNGDEFYASGLMAQEGFDMISASQLSKALNVLHDQGRITLSHMGKGGSKHYRLVA